MYETLTDADSVDPETKSWDEFVYWGRRFYETEDYWANARAEKLKLAVQLQDARAALQSNSPDWIDLLSRAFKRPGALINPKSSGSFIAWCRREPDRAASAFRMIWDETQSLATRFDGFVESIYSKGGKRFIAEAAFPNMAIDPNRYPMFRVTQVEEAMVLTGYADRREMRGTPAGARYEHYLGFLDRIIAESARRNLNLRDRLDAQGLIWAVIEGHPGSDWAEQDRHALRAYRGDMASGEPQPSEANGHRFWALLANPNRYRIEDAIRDLTLDSWTTKGKPVRAGDRFLIWKAKGRSKQRGIVAFGEVLSDPEERLPKNLSYWTSPEEVEEELRVRIRYVLPPNVPVWAEPANSTVLDNLAVARAKGGTVFSLSTEQWEQALELAGGWPDDATKSITSEDVTQAALHLDRQGAFDLANLDDTRVRLSQSIAVRQGQPKFRADLLRAYEGRCTITGCTVVELLEAAHIVPYKGDSTNHVQNGLLLRADIHILFDMGLLSIDPATWTVIITAALIGTEYEQYAGVPIRLPTDIGSRPSAECLHMRGLMWDPNEP